VKLSKLKRFLVTLLLADKFKKLPKIIFELDEKL
jgi:hypothetical protein